MSETTVQESNTTFPTDAKWCKKVIDYCNKIAGKENIAQRQRYTRVSKQLLRDTYNGKHPDGLVYDRGGKGKNTDQRRQNCYAFSTKKTDTPYQKRVMRKKFRTRAAIGPIIGHLKTDFRVAQNYFWGKSGPQINAFIAVTAWNLKKMMEILKENLKNYFFEIGFRWKNQPENFKNDSFRVLIRSDYLVLTHSLLNFFLIKKSSKKRTTNLKIAYIYLCISKLQYVGKKGYIPPFSSARDGAKRLLETWATTAEVYLTNHWYRFVLGINDYQFKEENLQRRLIYSPTDDKVQYYTAPVLI